MGIESCAELLHVSERTVRNWEAGIARIPYAAYKLVRVLKGGKVLGPQWEHFHVWGDTLHTPEGHRFKFSDLAWWSLLVRQAREFQQIMRDRRLEAAAAAEAVAPAPAAIPATPLDIAANGPVASSASIPEPNVGRQRSTRVDSRQAAHLRPKNPANLGDRGQIMPLSLTPESRPKHSPPRSSRRANRALAVHS